ncbi:MAG: DUF4168 domain-containing protein [Balneolaceae bacterium]|nr:DUF4168 domain-containing protein [Balneolaceae bacterium]
MRVFFKSVLLLVGILLFSTTVFAQGTQQVQPLDPESVTDEQLETFSAISAQFQVAQQKAVEKFKVIVEEGGMKYSRFQQLVMLQQNPQVAPDSLKITEAEKKIMQEIQPEMMQQQQKMQQKMMGIISEEGISPQKFQQLAMTIRQTPELQQRLQKIAEENKDN